MHFRDRARRNLLRLVSISDFSAIKKRPVLALGGTDVFEALKIVLTGPRASGLDYATCRIRENWND